MNPISVITNVESAHEFVVGATGALQKIINEHEGSSVEFYFLLQLDSDLIAIQESLLEAEERIHWIKEQNFEQ